MLEGIADALLPPEIDGGLLFLVAGSVSAILFSVAKSGFGGSIGILAVPIMIFACGGQASFAVGLLLPMLIVADYVAVVLWWRQWDGRAVLRILPGAALGIGLATAGLAVLQGRGAETGQALLDQGLKVAIGVIALGFVALHAVRWLRGRPIVVEPTWPRTLFVGTVAGVTSTLAHAAGPVVAMAMLALGLEKRTYVATIALVFWAINHMKLPTFIAFGMIRPDTLGATLLLVPAIAIGAVAGRLLNRRLGQRNFLSVVYVLLALAGVGLLYHGLKALLG